MERYSAAVTRSTKIFPQDLKFATSVVWWLGKLFL